MNIVNHKAPNINKTCEGHFARMGEDRTAFIEGINGSGGQ